MDFKKLATYVVILGVLVLGYGGFQWLSNQPKKINPSQAKGGLAGFGEALSVQTENLIRVGARKKATKIIIAGGIVIFIGAGVYASAKQK